MANKNKFLELAGKWKEIDDVEEVFKKVLDERRKAKFRY